MESFTHESDESSSCTQSDGDSTNSSNGTNPFLLCPRANSSLHLQLGGQGRAHDTTEDTRPFKLARMEPPRHHQYHASAIANPLGASSLQYPHNMVGAIRGADGLHNPALLSQSRSYASTALEDCRSPAAQAASAARSHHGSLPYLGPTQAFLTPDQWAELRQQAYVLKHVAACNTPPSALLLPMGCKVENVPVNFGSNAGSYFVGLADPQPGRCRRTDGKKWRCGRAVVPDQKYCERHMHRGRGRSKAARLAKVNAPADGNQPLNSARPLNQPLIQLLNQLAVPVQPLNQPPEPVQKPPIPAQPLQWLGNPAQPFFQPHAHLPLVAQPLNAEQLSHVPNPSKPLDWPLNQTPMEAEPLDIVHPYGVPPNLAQAIPINTVSEVRSTHNPANGSRMPEGRRAQADNHDDVFTLDVQGIKRLLENAPCSMHFKKLANQKKQLPNLADLLNVAHFRSPTSQPKRPPSLMDVLKMVDPGTATTTNTTTTSTSVINHQLQCTAKDNGSLPVNGDQAGRDLPAREHVRAPLSLVWPDEQAAEGQSKKYSSSTAILSGSLNLVGARQEDDTTSLKSFKVKREKEEGEEGVDQNMAECVQHKGSCLLPMTGVDIVKTRGPSTSLAAACENHTVNVSGCQSEPPSLVKESPDCFGSSAISEKTTSNPLDNRNENSAEFSKNTLTLIDAHLAKTDENSPNLVKESLKGHKHTVKLDINSPGEEHDHLISVKESQENSMELRESGFKHHESSSEAERGSLNLLKGSRDRCETPVKPEKSVPCLSEKSQEEYEPSASPHTNRPVSVRKSTDWQENPGSLDMNSPILVEETSELYGGSGELDKNSTGSGSPTRVLQIKATFVRSPSDNSCNVNSSSKSTLILEPAALNNTEPLSQVSLAT